jgi:SAM-dependent methyltransferase
VSCPICGGPWRPGPETYTVGGIFGVWEDLGYRFGEQVRREYDPDLAVRLVSCAECGFGAFEPSVAGTDLFYEELAEMGRSWYYLADKWEYQVALADVDGCSRILDVGCGRGFFLERCRQRGIAGVGLELNRGAVATARAEGLDVREVPVERFAAENAGAFDAVCLFQVLEHVPRPLDLVAPAVACLKRGGLLIVAVPNAAGLLRLTDQAPANVPPHHLSRWTPASLAAVGRRFGLAPYRERFESPHRLLPSLAERALHGRIPSAVLGSRFWQFSLRVASQAGRLLPLAGRADLQGHTLYAALRKA